MLIGARERSSRGGRSAYDILSGATTMRALGSALSDLAIGQLL
jgi:hypothetical protein